MGTGTAIEPGDRIGDFTVTELLGEGGFGRVYRCLAKDKTEVAIKIQKAPVATSATQLVLVQNEIEALKRLHHPSTVRLHSFGLLEDGQVYLAMELVEGEPLNKYLQRHGRLDTVEAIRIVTKVAECLAHCHEFSVLHLDLKPSNIVLVDPHEPTIKVLDFGLAQLTRSWESASSYEVKGTPIYLAPECMVRGVSVQPGPQVDLYALGAIFYELLAGKPPFAGDHDQQELLRLKQHDKFTSLRELAPLVPEPVMAFVDELLTHDPAWRPTSAARVAARLRSLYYLALHGTGGDDRDHSDGIDLARANTDESPALRLVVSRPEIPAEEVPFVGRARELDGLWKRYTAAQSGRGQSVALVGEPGIGKSRVLGEVLNRVESASEAVIGYGRCRELGSLVAYSSLREALAQIARALLYGRSEKLKDGRQAAAEVLTGAVRTLENIVPELGWLAARSSSGAAARSSLPPRTVAQAIGRVLTAIAKAVPVILAIEDLHWADQGTQQVLNDLAASLGERVFLVVTSRPVGEGLAGVAETIHLGPLDAADNKRLLGKLSDSGLVAKLVDSVPLLASGNPLFNIQVLQNLEQEGYLTRSSDGLVELTGGIGKSYRPPDSVSEVLRRTLDALPAPTRSVLSVAALLGRSFLIADLEALALFSAEEISTALAQAAERQLCRVVDDTGNFAHDTIREALEASVDQARRPGFHDAIAKRLERRGGEPGALGHHLALAGRKLDAAIAFFQAGTEADRLRDAMSAARHFERAVDLLINLPADDDRNLRLLRSAYEFARVGCLLDDTGSTLKLLDRTAAALGDALPPERKIALKAAYARVHYVRGEFVQAVGLSRECLAVQSQDPSVRVYHMVPANIIGRALVAGGRPGPALGPLKKGCEMAEAAAEASELCHSLGLLGVALSYTGSFAEAREAIDYSARLARELADPVRLLAASFYRAVLAECQFDWEEGIRQTTRLLRQAEQLSMGGLYLYAGTIYAGRHQFHMGRIERARVLLGNAISLGDRFGIVSMGRGWAWAFLGDVHFVAGRMQKAEEAYRKAVEYGLAGGGDDHSWALGMVGLAHCAARMHRDLATLRKIYDEVMAKMRAIDLLTPQLHALERFAEGFAELGATDEAKRCLADREALATRLGATRRDFWPEVPKELAHRVGEEGAAPSTATILTPSSARDFWSRFHKEESTQQARVKVALDPTLARLTPAESSHHAAPDARTEIGMPASEKDGEPCDLLESLSTIESYDLKLKNR
jgi:tetratricopeptide (TPR) repeat protein